MEGISHSIRLDMRLILLFCIVLIFPLLQKPPDVVGYGVDIADQIANWSHTWRKIFKHFDEDTKRKLEDYHRGAHSEDAPLYQDDKRRHVSEMKVEDLLTIRSVLTPRQLENISNASESEPDAEFRVNFNILKDRLTKVGVVYLETLSPKSATFEQLASAVYKRSEVTIPFVNKNFRAEDAIWVIIFALLGIFVHLTSLMHALGASIKRGDKLEGLDLVWLHPSISGFIIGCIWISLPLVIISISIILDLMTVPAGIIMEAVLLFFGLLCAAQGVKVRRLLLERFKGEAETTA